MPSKVFQYLIMFGILSTIGRKKTMKVTLTENIAVIDKER